MHYNVLGMLFNVFFLFCRTYVLICRYLTIRWQMGHRHKTVKVIGKS